MQTQAFTASAVKLHFYGHTMIGILSLGGAKVLSRKMWCEWRTLVHTHLAVFLRAYRSAFQRPTFLFCERFPYARSLNASAHGRFPLIQPRIPEISVGASNGTDHFGLVRPEYSGPALKVVHFDRTGYLSRSDRNTVASLPPECTVPLGTWNFRNCVE